MKNFKTLSTVLVVICLSLSGCASGLPRPPEFDLYIHNQPRGTALCTHMGTTCPAIPISATHKFYMLHPRAWESLQNYLDALIRAIEEGRSFEGIEMYGADPGNVPLALGDLKKMRDKVRASEAGLKKQIR